MDTLRVHWTGLASGVPSSGLDGTTYAADQVLVVYWPLITRSSIVLVSACECRPYDYSVPSFTSRIPDRFIGAAPVVVKNVAPENGRVEIVIEVRSNDPLNVITDIVVLDKPEVVVEAGDGTVPSADLPVAVSQAVSTLPSAQQEKLRRELAAEGGPKMKVRTAVRKPRRAR
jgi:hypothetical protein